MRELVFLALRNLRRGRRRNFATGAAIAAGFAALMALAGYTYRADNFLRVFTIYGDRIGHLLVYKKDGLTQFAAKPAEASFSPAEMQLVTNSLRDLPQVAIASPMLRGYGLLGNGCKTVPFYATGIDPLVDRELKRHPEVAKWVPDLGKLKKGRPLWEFSEEEGAIIIGQGLARLLNKEKVHDEFPSPSGTVTVVDCQSPHKRDQIMADANVQLATATWDGMLTALDGEVVGIYVAGTPDMNNTFLLTSLARLQKLYETDHVGFYSLWLHDPEQAPALRHELRQRLAAAGLPVDVYLWHEEAVNPQYAGTMQFLRVMVTFLGLILLVVIAFSVFNAATITVIERSVEIGMLRSLGFTRAFIRRAFMMEMVLVSAIALLIGGVMGGLGIAVINRLHIPYRPPGMAEGTYLALVVPGGVTLVAALGILLLAMATTWLAVRAVANRGIPDLLMGHQR